MDMQKTAAGMTRRSRKRKRETIPTLPPHPDGPTTTLFMVGKLPKTLTKVIQFPLWQFGPETISEGWSDAVLAICVQVKVSELITGFKTSIKEYNEKHDRLERDEIEEHDEFVRRRTRDNRPFTARYEPEERNVSTCETTSPSFWKWPGCDMIEATPGKLPDGHGVKHFTDWVNEIHHWGLTVHGPSCGRDLQFCIRVAEKNARASLGGNPDSDIEVDEGGARKGTARRVLR
ncbi:hypothetical protein MMC13_000239 [Lambiella insularis]|nr:hypothetical protein [Lambiella insularis]